MAEFSTDDGPRHAVLGGVDTHYLFARDHAVAESHDARIAFHFGVYDEPGHQLRMQRAHVPQRGPHAVHGGVDANFFANTGHVCLRCFAYVGRASAQMPSVSG